MHYIEEIKDGMRIRTYSNGAVERVPVDLIAEPKPKPKPKIYLTITLDQETVIAGTTVNATAEVRDQDGNLAPINNTYFVPIVRNADNWQAKLLEVTFNNGQASTKFAINEPGIYMIRLDPIHPTPIAKLTESPILIVKDSAQQEMFRQKFD